MTKLQSLEPYNLFTSDPVLGRAIKREGAGASHDDLVSFGDQVGSKEVYQWGFEANRYSPESVSYTHLTLPTIE